MYAQDDESLAIDGKVMCNVLDEKGRQTQIMSAVGHSAGICYAQKKQVLCLLEMDRMRLSKPMKLSLHPYSWLRYSFETKTSPVMPYIHKQILLNI